MANYKSNPLVTIYIPTYNRIELLKRAVDSVRAQTYENIEIIIVDDCSTDGTQDYLSLLAKKDHRIRFFLKEKNSGACVSRNIAIENAKGEFITGLDDDDYFLNDRIEIFLKNSFSLEHYEFLYAGLIYEKENSLKRNYFFKPKKVDQKKIIYSNFVGNQIFCLTDKIKSIAGFDQKLGAWQDWDCWYRLLDKDGKAIFVENYSYVVDDNDRVRITSVNKKNKMINVFNYLCTKHKLSQSDRKILSINLFDYGVNINIGTIFNVNILNYFSIWFWIGLLSLIKKKYFR